MEHETICNAKITSCVLGLFGPDLKDGLNFIVKMDLELATGNIAVVHLNPYKIPELLELLGIRGFYGIEGQYVQVKYIGNKIPHVLKPIMAKPSDPWFELDNGKYFGSRILLDSEVEL